MLRQPLGRLTLILLGSVAVFPVAVAIGAPAGAVTPLEPPAAPGYVRATGISADGGTVLGYSNVYGGAYSAVGWSASGAATYYAVGIANSTAQAISADGSTVVGDHFALGVGDGAYVLNGGNVYYLPVLTGIQGNGALGVSADGSIVVGYSQAAANAGHAVQWSGPGWATLTDLGTLVPGGSSLARGVSGDGLIVVGDGDGFDSYEHALFWQGGTVHDLGTTGLISSAWGISADGSTIVGTADGIGFTDSHPTSWTGPGFATQTDLGSLGGTLGTAMAVNADGSIIVGNSALAGNGSTHAFRYANGTMADLNTLLSGAGVNMAGVSLTEAVGVSANGNYIAANDTFNGLAYLVYYSAGLGGLTTQAAQQASADAVARERQAAAIQHDAYAGILTGDLDRSGGGNQLGAFGLVGSAIVGLRGHGDLGGGWSISGGVAGGTSGFAGSNIGNGLMGAAALRYDFDTALAEFRPFVQVGGSLDLLNNVTSARVYPGGSGDGMTNGVLGSAYARLGVTRDFQSGDQLTLSGELGGRWLSTDAYAESLSASNPFPASFAAATDSQLVAKASAAWSHPVTATVDVTVRAAVGATVGGSSGLKVATTGFGTLSTGVDHAVWGELGGQLSWKLNQNSSIDLYATGMFGDSIGSNAHIGAGYHYSF